MTYQHGQPLFESLTYCTRCCLPASAEGVDFDELGICLACQSSEQKMHIDWTKRQKNLEEILEKHKALGGDYDCIIPVSGGKDSTFQLHVLTKVYGMKALAVTFSHNWFGPTGLRNLQNIVESFDVDHLMLTPSRSLINRLARKSLVEIGDSCWHCHAGVGAFPLQVAVRYKIPLLIWGESIAEMSGRATYEKPVLKFDRDYFTKVSAKKTPEEMCDDSISEDELSAFQLPSAEALEDVGVVGIHLGDYLFWDDERQMEFVRDTYGWLEDKVEGTYKCYKSVECRMAGVHDYTKFLKRGFGRGTDHASSDVRSGLLTREEGFELAKRYDIERPDALDFYLELSGYSEEEFERIMLEQRANHLASLHVTEEEFQHKLRDHRIRYELAQGEKSKEKSPIDEGGS